MHIHPLADIFPMMGPDAFAKLKESIRADGQIDPIITHEGYVLDGRNRLKACNELGKAPTFQQFSTLNLRNTTPEQYVWAKNMERRHLTDEQRAAIAVKWSQRLEEDARRRQIEEGRNAGRGHKKNLVVDSPQGLERTPKTREALAEMAQVSTNKIRVANEIRKANPEVLNKVVEGSMKLAEARKVVEAEPKDDGLSPAIDSLTNHAKPRRQEILEKSNIQRLLASMAQARTASSEILTKLNLKVIISGSTPSERAEWISIAKDCCKNFKKVAEALNDSIESA